MGRVYAGYFHYWYDDKWVDQIGRMVDRYINIPMLLSPIRGKGRTQRMRCLPFWTRFFQLTLIERKETATKLINAMYPEGRKGPRRGAGQDGRGGRRLQEGRRELLRRVFHVPGGTPHGHVARGTGSLQPALLQAGGARGRPAARHRPGTPRQEGIRRGAEVSGGDAIGRHPGAPGAGADGPMPPGAGPATRKRSGWRETPSWPGRA